MRTSIFVVSLLLVVAPLSGAGGQHIGSLQQGARIRVDPVRGKATTGLFSGTDSDSLRFRSSKSPARLTSLGLGDVQSVQVSGGRNRPLGALVNGLMGLGIGAAAGAVAGAAFHKESDCSSFICFNTSRSQDITFAALVFGPLGAVAGSMYGAVRGRERWEPVALR